MLVKRLTQRRYLAYAIKLDVLGKSVVIRQTISPVYYGFFRLLFSFCFTALIEMNRRHKAKLDALIRGQYRVVDDFKLPKELALPIDRDP